MSTFLNSFITELDARLTRDGYGSHNDKARALGVNAATWSRARRGLAHFSSSVVEAGLELYPDLSYYLAPQRPARSAA